MAQREELSRSSRRTSMLLALAFGVLALFLAAIGIYGVLAYLVAQRRREIGIRVARGSTHSGIVMRVVREGFALVGVGLALGMLAAISLRSVIRSEIYGVGPLDPLVVGASRLSLVWFTMRVHRSRTTRRAGGSGDRAGPTVIRQWTGGRLIRQERPCRSRGGVHLFEF